MDTNTITGGIASVTTSMEIDHLSWTQELAEAFASVGMMIEPEMIDRILALSVMGGFFVVLPLIILFVIALCYVFQKMGNKRYEALIPIHNQYVLITKAGKPGRWIFFSLFAAIPLIGWIVWGIGALVVYVLSSIALAKKFGKSTGFGVGMILLPFVFYPILARGDAKYTA